MMTLPQRGQPKVAADMLSLPVPTASVQEPVKPLVQLLVQSGVTMEQITDLTELTARDLDDINGRVPLTLVNLLWDLARQRVCPAIGLHLHGSYPRNHMHLVAHMAIRSTSLQQAVSTWRDHAALVCDADEIGVNARDNRIHIAYRLLDLRFEDISSTEHHLATVYSYACKFTERTDLIQEVRFRHSDPGYAARYETHFRCPVLFGAEENALVVDKQILSLPMVSSDPYLRDVLVRQAQAMQVERNADLINRVSRIIIARILKQQDITIDTVAGQVGMSSRTLSRSLQLHGRSYRGLVDVARRDVTLHMLKKQTPMAEIAEFLNFSETTALSRAFARWCGESIVEFRRRLEVEDNNPGKGVRLVRKRQHSKE